MKQFITFMIMILYSLISLAQKEKTIKESSSQRDRSERSTNIHFEKGETVEHRSAPERPTPEKPDRPDRDGREPASQPANSPTPSKQPVTLTQPTVESLKILQIRLKAFKTLKAILLGTGLAPFFNDNFIDMAKEILKKLTDKDYEALAKALNDVDKISKQSISDLATQTKLELDREYKEATDKELKEEIRREIKFWDRLENASYIAFNGEKLIDETSLAYIPTKIQFGIREITINNVLKEFRVVPFGFVVVNAKHNYIRYTIHFFYGYDSLDVANSNFKQLLGQTNELIKVVGFESDLEVYRNLPTLVIKMSDLKQDNWYADKPIYYRSMLRFSFNGAYRNDSDWQSSVYRPLSSGTKFGAK